MPAERRQDFAEEIVDLPGVLCFEPPTDAPPSGRCRLPRTVS